MGRKKWGQFREKTEQVSQQVLNSSLFSEKTGQTITKLVKLLMTIDEMLSPIFYNWLTVILNLKKTFYFLPNFKAISGSSVVR